MLKDDNNVKNKQYVIIINYTVCSTVENVLIVLDNKIE